MPAKAPIYLKPNAGKNGTSGGKGAKKLREILSAEMISPPLGDFRHMAHVGRGGKDDMFGDTTFLQEKGAPSNNGTASNSAGIPGFQSFRRKGAGKNSKKRNNSVPDSEWSEGGPVNKPQNGISEKQSPILQSALPLPLNDQQSSSTPSSPGQSGSENDGAKKMTNNNTEVHIISTPDTHLDAPTKPRRLTNDAPGSNGHVETKKSMNANGVTTPVNIKESHTYFSDTTSIDEGWSLELDLGTSLMDDVMGIMDKIEL